jgi:hypothetical protein
MKWFAALQSVLRSPGGRLSITYCPDAPPQEIALDGCMAEAGFNPERF